MSATPDTARSDRPDTPARTARRRPDRLGRRLVQLYAGLALYGVSMAFFVEGALGVMPWDVLHQGLVRLVPVSLGTMTILAGAVVLLLWIPLRQRPGLGTVSNVVVIGLVVDLALRVLPTPGPLVLRAVFVAVGVGLNAVATAAYIGARFGPGPRDGLMTGLVARTGWPVRVVRTAIEVSVVGLGWLLGGNFGPGTLLYALAVGPLVQPLLPLLRVAGPEPAGRADAPAGRS
ncbi:YitT family protein [Kineosporia sp. R_H_3]|uniref:membrane protein YczE n=1 Tax=Kineosporia sp. R_H_3 TaxID=1961848 RepID=UPI0013046649|nr:hypothetical protein [Kineosporia sp. R_H_3]